MTSFASHTGTRSHTSLMLVLCILTNHHDCRLLILASSFRDIAMLSSRASAHIPQAHSSILSALNLPTCSQKPAAITPLSPNLQSIFLLCKMFQRLYPAPRSTSLFTQNKTGQQKKREKKCSKNSVLDSGTCLTASKQLITQS